jgi:hypothetical protein
MRCIIRWMLLGSATALIVASCAWDQHALPVGKRALVLESFDVFNDGDALLVPIDFNGKRYLFTVDTGSSKTIYDASFAPQLGKVQGPGAFESPGRDVVLPMYESPSASLGRLRVQTNEPVAVFDLSKVRQVSGHECYGILGMNFLAKHIVRYDPDLGTLQFLQALDADPGMAFPLYLEDDCLPRVEMHVTGTDIKFVCMIDTGYSGFGSGDLTPDTFGLLTEKKKAMQVGECRTVTVDGESTSQVHCVTDVELGDFKHKGLYFSPTKYLQNLSLGFLRRYIVTFDFPNRTMYLKKSKQYDDADFRDRSGLHIFRPDGRIVLHSVDRESPADKAGLKACDVLLRVGDAATEKQRMYVLRRMLCEEGKTLALVVRRGDREITATLHLSEGDAPLLDMKRD